MRDCTMDDDCPSSEKERCFLCPGPARPGLALVSELSWQSDKQVSAAICSCSHLSRPEKKDKRYDCAFYFHFFW